MNILYILLKVATCNTWMFSFFCRSDPHTLVELVNFSAMGKMQPFSVDISTNCLLLMVGVSSGELVKNYCLTCFYML